MGDGEEKEKGQRKKEDKRTYLSYFCGLLAHIYA